MTGDGFAFFRWLTECHPYASNGRKVHDWSCATCRYIWDRMQRDALQREIEDTIWRNFRALRA